MTAKEMTELIVMSAIDPVPVLRGVVDVEDNEEVAPGGVVGVAEVVRFKVEASEVAIGVSLVSLVFAAPVVTLVFFAALPVVFVCTLVLVLEGGRLAWVVELTH